MKIVHLCTYDNGGAFNAAYRLHLGLLKNGVESKMLVLYKKNSTYETYHFLDKRSILKKIADSIKTRLFAIYVRNKFGNSAKYHLAVTPYRIHKHPLIKNCDIINIHWVNAFLDYPSFFKNVKKPLFWTLHDMAPFTPGYAYDTYYNEGLKKIYNYNTRVKKTGFDAINTLQIVSPSKWLHKLSSQSNFFEKYLHHLIPYGIETNRYNNYSKKESRSVLDLDVDSPILLFISEDNNDIRKGFNILLEALNDLGYPNILLLSVGKSKKIKTTNGVRHISMGYVKDEKRLSMIYSAADIFIIPSIEDNLPNTVIEALCSGIPVAGFNIGGLPDMVIDGENGYLANELSAMSLREAIISTLHLSKNIDRKDISRQASEKYALDHQADSYIKLYKTAIENNNKLNF